MVKLIISSTKEFGKECMFSLHVKCKSGYYVLSYDYEPMTMLIEVNHSLIGMLVYFNYEC